MEHKGTLILETERLVLRRFAGEDAGMVFSNWAGDDEVTKYMTWPTRRNIEETEKFPRGALRNRELAVIIRAWN